ncbi:MAG: tRNA (adenosine(37)-N6)-threonylcarbamoyltransferase complex ATPase subunit type 1 TsaE [Patescibacteria group bacterium]|jgi:tRNA threonylcarbamoyladenosine biosynthesis protein TsaE
MPKTWSIKNQLELKIVAEHLLDARPRLIALTGPLGAGKTTLTKEIGKLLGIKQALTSPTYVLEQIYHIHDHKDFHFLVHVDCYRLKDRYELPALDLEHWLSLDKTLVIIEWADKIKPWLEKFQPVWVKIQITGASRIVSF